LKEKNDMLKNKKITMGLVVVTVIIVTLVGCTPEPIKIGFVGELTGLRGEVGVMAREGAQLAVDEINAAGGIDGRPIELLIRDDQGDPEIARQVDAELVDEGVVAIIGHITSGQTAAVFDQMNAAEVVLISASATSSQFNDLDDYFLRTAANTDQSGTAFAEYIFNSRGVRQLGVIYDARNSAFAEPFWDALSGRFASLGGEIGQTYTVVSGDDDLEDLVSQISEHEAYVIIASAVDTALILQYAQQTELPGIFFGSSWAQTPELLENGGSAVEGLELITPYHPNNPNPAFQPFVERFESRYKHQPNILAPLSYDTVRILAQALEATGGEADGLREVILATQDFEGVQGLISFNPYGDVEMDLYVAQVKDGQFEIIETVSE
jgi:branched-chain amino acid transport system substrate-binding protein